MRHLLIDSDPTQVFIKRKEQEIKEDVVYVLHENLHLYQRVNLCYLQVHGCHWKIIVMKWISPVSKREISCVFFYCVVPRFFFRCLKPYIYVCEENRHETVSQDCRLTGRRLTCIMIGGHQNLHGRRGLTPPIVPIPHVCAVVFAYPYHWKQTNK